MAKGNKRRTTKRGLSWSSFRNSRPLWITAKTNVGSNKRSRSSFEGTTIASRFMFETALVNRKFAKRPKFETMKSLPPPRNSLFATQSPSPPARSSAIRAGKTASAALTVPLTAQAHQNEAKLKRSEEHTSELQSRLHLVCR